MTQPTSDLVNRARWFLSYAPWGFSKTDLLKQRFQIDHGTALAILEQIRKEDIHASSR